MEFLKISEFSMAIGVSTSTLRQWDKKGILTPHHKTPYGYRVYSQDQVDAYLTNGVKPDVQRN